MYRRTAFFLSILLMFCTVMVFAHEEALITVHSATSRILSDEQIYVTSCLPDDASEISHILMCLDNFNSKVLPLSSWNESCYVSYIDLTGFYCNRMSLQAIYTHEGEVYKPMESFLVRKVQISPEIILKSQLWDGGWATPSNTAYSIWTLSQYSGRFSAQIEQGFAWLKEQRDDDAKCWEYTFGSGVCSIYETSRTLAFLSLAGVNESVRIYSDALSWLERQQNYIEENDDEWTVRMEPEDITNCTVLYGGSSVYSDEIDNEFEVGYDEFTITPDYDKLINITCGNDTDVDITITDDFERIIYNGEITDDGENGTQLLHMIRSPCWSLDGRWGECNRQSTLYSLIANIDTTQKGLAAEWLEENLSIQGALGKYLSTSSYHFDTALYLYALDHSNDDVLEWLMRNQNNDGSWGSSNIVQDRIASTAMSILALNNKTFSPSSEVLADAKNWMSIVHPQGGWKTLKDDALSFMILKDNEREFLKLYGEAPVAIGGTENIVLLNPTHLVMANLTYMLTSPLSEIATSEGPNSVGAYSNITLQIKPKATSAGRYTGVLVVKEDNNTLINVPLVYDQDIQIALKPAATMYAFGDTAKLTLTVEKANTDFSCNIEWEDKLFASRFSINKPGDIIIPITLGVNKSGMQKGTFICKMGEFSHIMSFEVQLQKYDFPPLTVSPESVRIKKPGKNFTITVENMLDISVDVNAGFKSSQYFFTMSNREFTLKPYESIELTVVNQVLEQENATLDEIIEFTAYGQTSEVSLVVDILYEPGKYKMLIFILVFMVIIGGIGAGGYYGYLYRSSLVDFSKVCYGKIKTKIPAKYQKMLPKTKAEREAEADEADTAKKETDYFSEMVSIMKSMGKSDEEIAKRLMKEGLTRDQVNDVLDSYEESQKVQSSIKHEEDVLDLLKDVSDESGDVFKKLRDHGFSEEKVRDAMAELAHNIEDKENEIKKDAGLYEEDEIEDAEEEGDEKKK
jgi:hypothetical protein